jgi:hypothetical protein
MEYPTEEQLNPDEYKQDSLLDTTPTELWLSAMIIAAGIGLLARAIFDLWNRTT